MTLETGRTHQIRVHLAAIELPVAGDPTYGVRGELGLERQFLHAARLAFEHPFTGAPVDVRSPLPADLEAALARRPTRLTAVRRPARYDFRRPVPTPRRTTPWRGAGL